jgi:GR25 family glycosyltransferase involved in LPS biosynthesis
MASSPSQLANVSGSDYIYVLDQCLNQTTAPFIAIFEDDIVFADGWLSKTIQGLAQLRAQSNSWLYLRLFYTETSLRWREDQDFWYRYLWLTFLLLASASATCLTLVRYMYKPARRVLTFSTIAVFSLATVPAFTGLYFMIGKYTVHALSGVTRMDKYGCCTQALVFPRGQVPGLISYLTQ